MDIGIKHEKQLTTLQLKKSQAQKKPYQLR